MDHVMENKFLSKEAYCKNSLNEHDDDEIALQSRDEGCQLQVFESFVKEKHSLLGYVRALVEYSVRM